MLFMQASLFNVDSLRHRFIPCSGPFDDNFASEVGSSAYIPCELTGSLIDEFTAEQRKLKAIVICNSFSLPHSHVQRIFHS